MKASCAFSPSARRLLVALAAAGLASSAGAHGLWLAQRNGELAAVYGEGAEDDAYDPARVELRAALNAAGLPVGAQGEARGDRWLLRPAVGLARLGLRYDGGVWNEHLDGHWTLTDDIGSSNHEPVAGGNGVKRRWQLWRHASVSLAPADLARPLGLPLEIVPLTPLKGLRKGDGLVLQILWQGQPLAGAKVITDFLNDPLAPPLRADGEGRVTIALPGNGLNVIQTSHGEDCRQPSDVNRIGHSSTWSYAPPGAAE